MRFAGPNRHIFLVLIVTLGVLGPFQNCSLHKSEGKKQLESLLARQGSTASGGGCLPCLSENTAKIIFDTSALAQFFPLGSDKVCLVSSSIEMSGMDVAVCTFKLDGRLTGTPEQVQSNLGFSFINNEVNYYFNDALTTKSATDTTGIPLDERTFFGFAIDQVPSDSRYTYHFISSVRGIECRLVLQVEDIPSYQALREEATRRTALLLKDIDSHYSETCGEL